MNIASQIMDFLNAWLAFFRGRVSPITLVMAVAAAAGSMIVLLGLGAVRRVSLEDEAKRISGLQKPSWAERLQIRLIQAGVTISPRQFLLVGLGLGTAMGGFLILLGYITLGIVSIPSGLLLYYQVLMRRREKALAEFREQLPEAIDDAIEYFAISNNITETIRRLAADGPLALRPVFRETESLIDRTRATGAALISMSNRRPEPFFRQFLEALAQHEQTGSDLTPILTRLARAQRAQTRLHRRIYAAQAGGRLVGMVYGFAPTLFLIFMRSFGGEQNSQFYASAIGQVAQIVIALSGALTWWLTGIVARRGLYLDNVAAPRLNSAVHRTGLRKTIIDEEQLRAVQITEAMTA